jgi:hypothetical protein
MTSLPGHPAHCSCGACAYAVAEQLEAQVAQDMRETVDVAMVWLTGRTSAEPWRFAHQLMVAGVFRQAGLLGLIDCSRCGDRGCAWCQAQL